MNHYRVSAFDPAKRKSVIFNLSGSSPDEVREEVKSRGLRLNSLNALDSADSFAAFAPTEREERAESPYRLRIVGGSLAVLFVLLVIAGVRGISSTHASQSEPAAEAPAQPAPPLTYTVKEVTQAPIAAGKELAQSGAPDAPAQLQRNEHTKSQVVIGQTPDGQDPR